MMNLLKRISPKRQIGSSRISSAQPEVSPASEKKQPARAFHWESYAKGLFSFFVFIMLFAGAFGALWWADHYFRIQDVTVLGVSKHYGFRGENVLKGIRSWRFDPEEQKDYLTLANPYYEILAVRTSSPREVVVEVKRQIPAAYLDTGEGFFLLSTSGAVLEKMRTVESEQYPIISFYQRIPYTGYQRGDDIGLKEVKDSLYFLEALHNAKVSVNRIDIEGFHMLGLYTEENTFLFSSEKDIERQRYLLEQALIQFGVEGTKFSTLDVRFDKPVVRF